MDEGIALLRLARTAHTLFENYSGIEKRRLLNFVLSNCTWSMVNCTRKSRTL